MRFTIFKDITRLEHSLFGLPIVLAGALLALRKYPPLTVEAWLPILWIFPAFFAARISGMAFNQLIDRKIDAKNPRTQNRALPSQKIDASQVLSIAFLSLFSFLLICFQINPLCFYCSLGAAVLIGGYSYMKRIHASSHFILGLIHLCGPVMAWITVTGSLSWTPIFLGGAAFFVIAAEDIVYAIQDIEFDRMHRLHSIPARFGVKKSLWISRFSHFSSLVMLFLLGWITPLSLPYFLIIPFLGALFFLSHRKISKTPLEPLFFWNNVIFSFATLMAVLVGILPFFTGS